MTRVWKYSQQRGSALLVQLALADYANEQGVAWPKQSNLAQKARITPRQTRDLLRYLEGIGEVYMTPGCGRSKPSYYAILTALSDQEISAILIEWFDKTAEESAQITASILQKRKQTSANAKSGNPASEKAEIQRQKKRKSSVEKRAESGSGLPSPRSDPSLDPSLDPSYIDSTPPIPPANHSISFGASVYHYVAAGAARTVCGRTPAPRAGKFVPHLPECQACRRLIDDGPFLQALADLCYGPQAALTDTSVGNLAKTLGEIRSAMPNLTTETISGPFWAWWQQHTWQGRDKKQRPKPHEIRAEWPNFTAYTARQAVHTAGPEARGPRIFDIAGMKVVSN
jgi:hypothetical protein